MKLTEIIDIVKIFIMNLNVSEKLDLDIVRTLIMSFTALIAVFSFGNTIILWRKTNRPIISAFVETHSRGNIATTYNLLVINSGNRPAVDIQLRVVDIETLKKCLTQEIDHPKVVELFRCFSNEGIIPLLN
ncbi:hypothetical protein [Trichormus variabilis]|uniref:Uncharacterized protein n=1 Tax=Trichormus variabilis SAG 1403-4b TaxID=447716 RepID=A0A3S1CDC8_ANAVA|nr:hypothetical protein [Trichormus variabilis]MBD2625128.1 hypothetical protein [Trichormus variabilis FACHB-164]RUS99499.1 hypothetical protein DSM107003_00830 [Trichormus variabilis SAG 1403-4b]